jgi:asparagine synthase (glutamine-hydrolysing)
MCGVIGVSLDPAGAGDDAGALAWRGLARLRHRGPDGRGVSGNAHSAVGMCVLRVRSKPGDPVPFTDGRDAYAFNGEIYDTGTGAPDGGLAEAVAAYRCAPSRLDGMYASIRRTPDGGLHVVRDPFGIKPLYLRHQPGKVLLASELPALEAMGGPLRVRDAAIAQFLLLGRVVDGGTWYEEVEPVRAGERLQIRDGAVSWRTCDPPANAMATETVRGPGLMQETEATVRTAMRRAVERVLLAGRPVGAALSGGLDSTIVAVNLALHGVTGLRTVSVVPEGTGDGIRTLPCLRLPGTAWQTWEHRWTGFGPRQLLDGIGDAVAALGEPTAMTSAPMYAALAREARAAGIVVLLLGEGADELFGGYRSYLRLDSVPSAVEFYVSPEKISLVSALVGKDRCQQALESLRGALPVGGSTADVVRRFERMHSLEPLLRRADCLLMAQGIEGRTPFLHAGLGRLAEALPWQDLVHGGQTKLLLRQSYRQELPSWVVDEPKRPFRAPVDAWLSGPGHARTVGALAAQASLLARVGIAEAGLRALTRVLAVPAPEAAPTAFKLLTLAAWLGGPGC